MATQNCQGVQVFQKSWIRNFVFGPKLAKCRKSWSGRPCFQLCCHPVWTVSWRCEQWRPCLRRRPRLWGTLCRFWVSTRLTQFSTDFVGHFCSHFLSRRFYWTWSRHREINLINFGQSNYSNPDLNLNYWARLTACVESFSFFHSALSSKLLIFCLQPHLPIHWLTQSFGPHWDQFHFFEFSLCQTMSSKTVEIVV